MASGFYPILAPSAGSLSLEELDEWGRLDSLPLSLDSDVWLSAGIYGLRLEELTTSGGGLAISRTRSIASSSTFSTSGTLGAVRVRLGSGADSVSSGGVIEDSFLIRGLSGAASVTTAQSVAFGRIVHLSGTDTARVGESCTGARVRLGSGLAAASAFGSMEGSRQTVIPLAASGAHSGDSVRGYSVRGLTVYGSAQSGQSSALLRYRQDVLEGTAHGFGVFDPVRILFLADSEPARSGEAFAGHRVRPHSATLGAKSSEAVRTARIRQHTAHGIAQSAERASAFRIRTDSLDATASVSASSLLERIRLGAGGAGATTAEVITARLVRGFTAHGMAYAGGSLASVLVRLLAGELPAKSGESLELGRLFVIAGHDSVLADGDVLLARVLSGAVSGSAKSAESVFPEYKGWNWDKETEPSAPEWEQEATSPDTWVQKEQNAAVWVAHSVTAKDWAQKHGGVAQWQ